MLARSDSLGILKVKVEGFSRFPGPPGILPRPAQKPSGSVPGGDARPAGRRAGRQPAGNLLDPAYLFRGPEVAAMMDRLVCFRGRRFRPWSSPGSRAPPSWRNTRAGPRAARSHGAALRGPDSLIARFRRELAEDSAADSPRTADNFFRPLRPPRPLAESRPGAASLPPPPRKYQPQRHRGPERGHHHQQLPAASRS